MRKKALHVIVNFNIRYKAARDMITGIMRYAMAHPRWELMLRGNHPSNDGFVTDAGARVDGLISGYDLNRTDEPDQAEIRRLIRRGSTLRGVTVISVPSVDIAGIPCSRIDVDHREIARCAAKLFLSHGLTNFAYVGSPCRADLWSRERLEHFRTEIEQNEFTVSAFEPVEHRMSDWTDEIKRLGEWLKELPKPCGVFAAFDQRAKHVIDVCRQLDINIPKEIQVVGVDNEESICELTIPSLSSIAPDFEAAGFAAARELDRLMNGERHRPRTIKIQSTSFIERMSTTDFTRSGDRVNRALNFIRSHAREPIDVPQVAHAVGGCVRLLEKDFRSILGTSVCRSIQDCRLKEVANALRTSSVPLSVIARQSGFSSETYLKNLFRRTFGVTMSQYRREQSEKESASV